MNNSISGKKIEGPKKPDKPDFEQSLARLEEIVRKLESANLPLDEAMKLFEEGMQLSRDCQKQLEEAEARVEILMKKAGGGMMAQPFDPETKEKPCLPPPNEAACIFRGRSPRRGRRLGRTPASRRRAARFDSSGAALQ